MKGSDISTFRFHLAESGEAVGLDFTSHQVEQFCRYYDLVMRWNSLLHLTTITEPQSFVRRHLIESTFAVQHLLPALVRVWDLGSGAGLPGVPVAVLCPEIRVVLVESNRKKSVFLREVADNLHLDNLAVRHIRFENLQPFTQSECVTVRAIEKMAQAAGLILEKSRTASQVLLFGGDEFTSRFAGDCHTDWASQRYLLPFSQDRWLLSLTRST